MPEFKEHAPGTFCWVDLATTDSESAKRFYSEVFGWEATDEPAGPDSVYTRLSYGGKSVGALYKLTQEMLDQNIPPHWLSYISVESADETAAKAKELGGLVHTEPFDVMDVGRMAVIQDPTSAGFAIWQPKAHRGAQLRNEPASLCWNELLTNDVDRAGAFYSKLFGWNPVSQNIAGIDYTTFMVDEKTPAAGLMKLQPEMGEGIPPNWFVYFAVADCDETARKVRESGGDLLREPQSVEGMGRWTIIEDAQGAVCGVFQSA